MEDMKFQFSIGRAEESRKQHFFSQFTEITASGNSRFRWPWPRAATTAAAESAQWCALCTPSLCSLCMPENHGGGLTHVITRTTAGPRRERG